MKTLLVPGLDGSAAPHWQHWWAATDSHALMVDLSDPSHPDPARWEAELAGSILRHPGAVLVAPAEAQGQPRIQAFAPLREAPLHVPTTVVASRNDPWMRFQRARHLATAWRADLIDLGFAGHINAASGFGPWPAGKQLRDDLLLQSAPLPQPPIHHAAHPQR